MNLLHFELSKSTDDGGHFVKIENKILINVNNIEHLFFIKSFGSHMLTKFEHSLMLEANFTLSRYKRLTNATVCLKSKLQFLKRDGSIAVFI